MFSNKWETLMQALTLSSPTCPHTSTHTHTHINTLAVPLLSHCCSIKIILLLFVFRASLLLLRWLTKAPAPVNRIKDLTIKVNGKWKETPLNSTKAHIGHESIPGKSIQMQWIIYCHREFQRSCHSEAKVKDWIKKRQILLLSDLFVSEYVNIYITCPIVRL